MREYLMPIFWSAALAHGRLQKVEVAGRCVEGLAKAEQKAKPTR